MLQSAEAILGAAQHCHPGTWSSSEVESSSHITSGKRPAGDKERLQAALAAQPSIRHHLCELAGALGYASPHCAGLAVG